MNFKRTAIIALFLILLGGFYFVYEIKGRKGREEALQKESALFSVSMDKISALSFERVEDGKPQIFEFEKKGDTWLITKPVAARADSYTLNGLVQGVAFAKREAVIRENATEADLAQFGLKTPAFRLTVVQDNVKSEVLMGDLTIDSKSIYAKYPDKPQIFIVSSGFKNYLDRKVSDYRDKTVLALKPEDLVKVAVNGEYDTYLFEKSESGWKALQPDIKRQSPTEISGFIQSLLAARAIEFFEDTEKNRKEFGLEESRIYSEFYQKDKKEPVILKIGNINAPKGIVYAMVEGGGQIYGLNRIEQKKFETRPRNFVSRAIISDTPDKIANVTLTLKDKKMVLEKTMSQRKDAEGSLEVWTMKEPLQKKVDTSGVIALLRISAGLFASDAVAFDKGAAYYGLDKPWFTIKGSRDDKKELFNVAFGKLSPDKDHAGMFYCRVNNEDVVVLVNMPAVDEVVGVAKELMAGKNPIVESPED